MLKQTPKLSLDSLCYLLGNENTSLLQARYFHSRISTTPYVYLFYFACRMIDWRSVLHMYPWLWQLFPVLFGLSCCSNFSLVRLEIGSEGMFSWWGLSSRRLTRTRAVHLTSRPQTTRVVIDAAAAPAAITTQRAKGNHTADASNDPLGCNSEGKHGQRWKVHGNEWYACF